MGSDLRATLEQIFPTRLTALVFVGYMALFINLGLLVTASKNEKGELSYNPVTVIFITETLKLLASTTIYLREGNTFESLLNTASANKKLWLLYFGPASLYALYNILTYVNLQNYDPTTYFLLLQMRVVVTGILFQLLFRQVLSQVQWVSLFLLTAGCVVKQYDFEAPLGIVVDHSLLLIFLQVFASCFAGVYNEYLLKGKSGNVHAMIQNCFMYSAAMIVNAAVLSFQGQLSTAFTSEAFATIWQWPVIALIINNAAVGIVTSLFLKYLNSVLKTFASALELMFTAILAWAFFGIPITMQTVIAILLVSAAIYIYSLQPVTHAAAAAPASSEPRKQTV